MKIGPKLPGPAGPPDVEGLEVGRVAHETPEIGAARRFAEALGTGAVEGPSPSNGLAVADAVASIVARHGTGELARAETLRRVAETVVGTWPADLGDATMRARVIEQLVEHLESDPTFTTLLGIAAGGPR